MTTKITGIRRRENPIYPLKSKNKKFVLLNENRSFAHRTNFSERIMCVCVCMPYVILKKIMLRK